MFRDGGSLTGRTTLAIDFLGDCRSTSVSRRNDGLASAFGGRCHSASCFDVFGQGLLQGKGSHGHEYFLDNIIGGRINIVFIAVGIHSSSPIVVLGTSTQSHGGEAMMTGVVVVVVVQRRRKARPLRPRSPSRPFSRQQRYCQGKVCNLHGEDREVENPPMTRQYGSEPKILTEIGYNYYYFWSH